MSGPRSTVQEEHPQIRVVADALGPDSVAPARRLDGDHANATAESVVASGVVEVTAHEVHPRASRPTGVLAGHGEPEMARSRAQESPSASVPHGHLCDRLAGRE